MAKKKMARKGTRKKKGGKMDAKKIIVAISWFAMVLVLLFFVGRYLIQNNFGDGERDSIAHINLCEVELADTLKVETHDYKGFRVYFNSMYHIPNCVSYELTRAETSGEVPRYKNFDTDPNFAESANPWDYTNSGYDRGHMVPAADMKWDAEAMRESFYMSNVCPQNKSLNAGAWSKLEKRIREWAERDSALVIVTGPVLSQGMERIGDSRVAVPKRFFKVVLAPYVGKARAIAFIYKNEKSRGEMKDYVVTVDSVESLTGHNFFAALPDEIEQRVESVSNLKEWNQR